MNLKNPINFIKKANKCFNLYLMNYNKINRFIKDFYDSQKRINNLFNEYSKNNNYLTEKMDLFTDSYFKKKYYFFNGQEKSFESMDTDAFFQMCIYNNIKLLSFSPSENRILLQTEDGIILATNNRFWTIDSVFARNEYSVPQIYMFKDFVVFDIGMNRGYASLKFASFDSCKKVYGFEIDPDTYNLALENFNLNPELYDKIKPFNFGLYDDECELDLFYIPGYDGITTTKLEFTKNQTEWVKQKEQMQIKKVHVKEAGQILSDIIKDENIQSNIILKIDTEGAESKILDNLIKHEFIDKLDLIIGETHLESEDLELKLPGFKSVNKFYSDEKIYNFCLVKDKWYNELNQAKSSNK